MAMLAGPRRKQKVINLRAKNNAWSEDSSKFGQRMLERMGWAHGKGLGAREDGAVEHVIARYKNDEHGLGFNDKNDQWTQHEDQFNALLAGLSNGADEVVEEKGALHSGVSLEVKSKQSKARVHYHKFTRGKDLSRYSQKDLANIFGKKSLAPERSENVDTIPSENEPRFTEQVFTDGGSMDSYFKSKLKSFAKTVQPVDRDEDVDCGFKGFSGGAQETKDVADHEEFEFNPLLGHNKQEITETLEVLEDVVNCEKIRKKKKKKQTTELVDSVSKDMTHKKKRKSKKSKDVHLEICDDILVDDGSHETEDSKKSKKKKKSKQSYDAYPGINECADSAAANEPHDCEHVSANVVIGVKKRKSKRKCIEETIEVPEEEKEEPIKKKKKKDKKKRIISK